MVQYQTKNELKLTIFVMDNPVAWKNFANQETQILLLAAFFTVA